MVEEGSSAEEEAMIDLKASSSDCPFSCATIPSSLLEPAEEEEEEEMATADFSATTIPSSLLEPAEEEEEMATAAFSATTWASLLRSTSFLALLFSLHLPRASLVVRDTALSKTSVGICF